jgi:hypothetical protein
MAIKLSRLEFPVRQGSKYRSIKPLVLGSALLRDAAGLRVYHRVMRLLQRGLEAPVLRVFLLAGCAARQHSRGSEFGGCTGLLQLG